MDKCAICGGECENYSVVLGWLGAWKVCSTCRGKYSDFDDLVASLIASGAQMMGETAKRSVRRADSRVAFSGGARRF
jgi:hypothetical protein